MIYFVLIIIGLLILGVILSYMIVILVTMFGFIVGKIIKNFKLNHTFNPFDKKVYTSQTCRDDGWYAQYCEHLINHRKDFWWVPIWYFNKIGLRFCMAKKQSYNQGYDGVKKCPSDFIPKVLNNGISQPSPKSHADNLTRGATKCKQNHMNPYDSVNEFDKYIAFAEGEESERKRICKKLIDEGYFETNTEFYGALLNEQNKG